MRISFRQSFKRDLKKIEDSELLTRIQETIQEVERAETPQEINNLTKLKGKTGFFRLRVGDYRLGIVLSGDRVDFVPCLPRNEIYRFFP